MALYRIKPGFDPKSASGPSWNFDGGMDYLLTSVFEIQKGACWNNYLVTVDRHGYSVYLHPDWIEPASIKIDLTVIGDEI